MLVRKNLRLWEGLGFLIACAGGMLLQFLFKWTGGSILVAAFAGVNESTWEHMKLLYVPYFVFTMLEFPVFAEPLRNFFAAKATAGAAGALFIPVLYYTANGMFGKTPDWFNIAVFFASTAAAYLLSYRLLTTLSLRGTAMQLTGFLLLWGLMLLFVLFTYRPPRLPLFLDPVTQAYGIPPKNM